MLRKLLVFVVCLIAAVATFSALTPSYKKIWYTTTDGRTISFDANNLVSNSYRNGRGVLKFRNSVTSIGCFAFDDCSSLTSITIPNSVTSIGDYAFSDCSSLTSITIPESVTSIGNGAFDGCSSLKSFKGKFASSDGRCLNIDGRLIGFAPAGLTSYTIPNSVTSIECCAFISCSNLKSFKGKFASSDGRCLIKDGELITFAPAGLISYTIPTSVTSIGSHAFRDCSSLTSITIPNSVTEIGTSTFLGCSSLTSITIPNSVTEIGNSAFRGCSSLKSITIPNSVTSIGHFAFDDCSSLKSFKGKFASSDGRCLIKDGELIAYAPAGLTSYTIPNSVTSIGSGAFAICSSLTSITIPNSVTEIRGYAFWDCSSLTSITIPNSVTSIGEHAFSGCSSLKSITIPNSVKRIGYYAFSGCSSLTSITIPDSVPWIGGSAFLDCSSLTSITIPNSITSIGYQAFSGCSSLTSITCLATTPPIIIDDLMIGETTMIYVPKETVKAYKQDPKWSIYKKQIQPIK